MSETENPLSTSERLPDIYSNNNNNNQNSSKQSIAKRNQVIDDYIKSLDQEKNNKKNDSSSDEDDKDPFSSKAIKNLKPLKKVKNRLILPNFQREKLKSETNSRNNKNKSMPKNITNENFFKKNKKMQKK